MSTKKHLVVFSGGSAANNLIDVFKTLASKGNRALDFVLPISDNGGSTSEILRVFGGPGIGDVRSRLIRLVPEDTEDVELIAIKSLLNYRLPPSNDEARLEWLAIVEGTHGLWKHISSEKRELLRSFFVLLNLELLKRQRPKSSFNFHSASIGNLFLTGARIFFGSFESAIYLFRSITGIPENVQVIPAINSNFAHHIAAGLADKSVIIGQNQISHPSNLSALPIPAESQPSSKNGSEKDFDVFEEEPEEPEEDANLPGSLASLRTQNIEFSKIEETAMSSRIERIWYINPYGQEIRPHANPKVLTAIENSQAIIYSIGSLYTSLIPCLVLRNIGMALAATGRNTPKILLLNGSHDRETGPDNASFTAAEFVRAVAQSCAYSDSAFKDKELKPQDWNKYLTHVIYLVGNGAPMVNDDELKALGIDAFQVYGRRNPVEGRGMLYDSTALGQTLEMILAKRLRKTETRRMTMDTYYESPRGGNGDRGGNVNSNGWTAGKCS
ncbi:hypothetical protein DFP73DRAFT_539208 [Morchella snyderi]|nr:hypothetical protein DFP73DRAFT_539208 [Morchella snyderi]